MTRTLILSDIHFGNRSSNVRSVDQLRPLWQGFDSLILNGDTSEIHSSASRERSRDYIEKIRSDSSADNVQLTFVCGNHDPTISETEHLWFHDEKTLVFHGHAPIRGLAPWSWRCKYIIKAIEGCLEKSGDGFDEQLAATREASILAATGGFNHHRPSTPNMLLLGFPAAFQVLRCWWNYPTLVANWVRRYAPSAQHIIVGHTHHAGIWNRDDITILNTGCFGFPSHPRAVVIDGNSISVHRVIKRDGIYELGRVCKSWNAL